MRLPSPSLHSPFPKLVSYFFLQTLNLATEGSLEWGGSAQWFQLVCT